MTTNNKQNHLWMLSIISVIPVVLAGCKKSPAEPQDATQSGGGDTADIVVPRQTDTPIAAVEETGSEPKLRLADVVRNARTWGPIHTSWYGEKAPNFTITDISGKVHKLSNYRGKDVMLVFWATWCRYCIVEMPHLIALQNIKGRDNLAILGISYTSPIESTAKVKSFVDSYGKLNYPIFSVSQNSVPVPFRRIDSLPSSFFIDAAGKIKLATAGTLTLGDMKAILEAQ